MATSLAKWTATTLTAHLRGVLNVNPDAPGGTTPNRVMEIAIAAAIELWNCHDWIFRQKQGTLAISATDTTEALPADYGEMSHRWIRDNNEYGELKFYDDPGTWQREVDDYADTDDGPPRFALITRDTTTSPYKWYIKFSPTADQNYSYLYWYVVCDPWTGAVITTDTTAPIWPTTFFEGWRLLARWKVLADYGKDERARDARRDWLEWKKQQISENDERATMPSGMTRVDGYGDFGRRRRWRLEIRNTSG